MREILGVGWIDPRRVSDALSMRGHDASQQGQTRTYDREPFHDALPVSGRMLLAIENVAKFQSMLCITAF